MYRYGRLSPKMVPNFFVSSALEEGGFFKGVVEIFTTMLKREMFRGKYLSIERLILKCL